MSGQTVFVVSLLDRDGIIRVDSILGEDCRVEGQLDRWAAYLCFYGEENPTAAALSSSYVVV